MTAEAVMRELASTVGLGAAWTSYPREARHNLLNQLVHTTGIICLDNLETPLDADKSELEDLLNELAALDSVALIITSRDTSIPAIKWTYPSLTCHT